MGAAGVSVLLAGIAGGLIANRVRGVYFALITFGMAQVVAKVVYNSRELGASDGLIGIPVIEIPLGLITLSAGDPLGVLPACAGDHSAALFRVGLPAGDAVRPDHHCAESQ